MLGGYLQLIKDIYKKDRSFFLFFSLACAVILFVVTTWIWVQANAFVPSDRFQIAYLEWDDADELQENADAFFSSIKQRLDQNNATLEVITYNLFTDPDLLRQAMNELSSSRVDLIFAQTDELNALLASYDNQIPVAFSMTRYPRELGVVSSYQIPDTKHVGVRSWISADRELAVLNSVIPDASNIYLFSDRTLSSWVHKKDDLIQSSKRYGYNVTPTTINSIETLNEVNDKSVAYIDCFTESQQEQEKVIVNQLSTVFAHVITCNPKFVVDGAAFSLFTDNHTTGELLGTLSSELLLAGGISYSSVGVSQQVSVFINDEYRTADLFISSQVASMVKEF